MAETSKGQVKWKPLPRWARICAAALGLALVVLAFGVLVCPFPTAREWSGYDYPLTSSRNAADLVTFATACLLAGLALIAYAINGVRLLRFGFGSSYVDGSDVADDARAYYDRPESESAEDVDGEGDAPQPAEGIGLPSA